METAKLIFRVGDHRGVRWLDKDEHIYPLRMLASLTSQQPAARRQVRDGLCTSKPAGSIGGQTEQGKRT
jgi:hypothetical protein